MQALITYLLTAMLAWSPLENHRYLLTHMASNADRDSYTEARYESIAKDLADVVDSEPPVFSGATGKAETALVLLSIASYESGDFREDIDTIKGTGDHGKAHCIMQIEYPLRAGETLNDRKDCFRIGLSRVRESMKACPKSKVEERLAVYARGKCDDNWGINNSKMKMHRARGWFKSHPFATLVQESN